MVENRWVSDLHWRREGSYSRSEKTQSALLDAAEALILEHGTENVSVNDIVKSAGSSVGSFYHHFKDKTALFYALFDRTTKSFAATSEDAVRPSRWEGATIRDILAGFIEFSLRQAKEAPAFKAAALLLASEHPELQTHYSELQAKMYKNLRKLVLDRKAEIGHPDPEKAIAFVLNQLGAMLRARLDDKQRAIQLKPGTDKQFTEYALTSAAQFLDLQTGTQNQKPKSMSGRRHRCKHWSGS